MWPVIQRSRIQIKTVVVTCLQDLCFDNARKKIRCDHKPLNSAFCGVIKCYCLSPFPLYSIGMYQQFTGPLIKYFRVARLCEGTNNTLQKNLVDHNSSNKPSTVSIKLSRLPRDGHTKMCRNNFFNSTGMCQSVGYRSK